MIAAGHRRTAAFFSHDSVVTRKYEQGFRHALVERGLELPPDATHFGSSSLGAAGCDEHDAGIESALKRLMALPPDQRPTALFVPWEGDAELVYFTLVSLGVRVPDEVSLVTFGSSWRGSAICRRMSAITIDENEVGRMAAKLLIGMARDRKLHVSQERQMIPLHRHQGQTLGPAPKQGAAS
jgi:DNA-binding LacI/PurR family transcriptional regulator